MNPAALLRIQQAAAAQPGLFDSETEQELESGITSAGRRLFERKQWDINGRISTKDEQKAMQVLACLASGMSRRKIREICRVHHYTIDAIDQAATKGGHLEPLKERVRQAVARLALEAIEETREALQNKDRDMDAAQWLKAAGTVMGIAVDKDQLLTGLPTEIIEQRSAPGRADLEAFLAQSGLQVVSPAAAVDVESPASTPNQLMRSGSSCLHTVGHTVHPAPTSADPSVIAAVGQVQPESRVEPPAQTGGAGGAISAGAGHIIDGSGTPEISH